MTTTSRIRRVRPGATPVAQAAITAKLKSVSKLMVEMGKLNTLYEEEMQELQKLLKASHLTHAAIPEAVADIVTPSGKSVNTIDPREFRKLVDDDKDFFEAVTVSVTKAKALLSERELAAITTTTPAKAGEPKLVVKLTAK